MSARDDRIRKLYELALKRPIGERAAFVAERSGRDDDMRRRVDALLTGQQETQLPGQEVAGGSVLAAGTQIGTYRIDGPLGAGGMGIVYRATDTKLDRPAAIKVLPENLADSEARRRFQREARMVSSLNHPHIVTVYDAGEYQDRQYLITEYVDGGTLRQWAARSRGWQQIVELLIGVADGLAVAHEAGILHRDIKPENILLAKNGYAKLADFGLAKLLEVDPLADDVLGAIKPGDNSTLIGTAAYMSPEQAQGHALDGRSDVYSFGLVLYELLSGARLPPRQGTKEQALPALAEEVPASLCTIVAKALEREPDDRYQTMRDLVVDLRRFLRTSGSQDGLPSRPLDPSVAGSGVVRRSNARRVMYAAAGVAVVVALLLAGYYRDALRGPTPSKAIAVLPFANETGDPDNAQISEGVGDTLRDRLTGLPGISVQARASSASFRDQNVDPRTIARDLGVGVLINGTLRKQGKMLEVVVEMLDDKGFAIRQPFTFERPEQDLQALQQQIAAEVGAVLVPAARAVLAAAAPTPTAQSESANMLVLFGNHSYYEVRDNFTIDEKKLDRAIGYYRQAIQADTHSIVAHTRLASALLYKGDVEAPSELLAALKLAESIDPSAVSAELSDVYYTSALYLVRTRQPGAEDAYEKALALNPSNVDALGDYAKWLLIHFRVRDAYALYRQAIRLDRQTISRYAEYADALGSNDVIDELHELGGEIAARFPNARGYRTLCTLYDQSGELDVGIAWCLKALRSEPEHDETRAQIAELFTKIGDYAQAAKYEPTPGLGRLWLEGRYSELIDAAQEYVIEYPDEFAVKYMLAFAYNATGDFKAAKDLLEQMGIPAPPDTDTGEGNQGKAEMSYVDALQSLGGNDALAAKLAQRGLEYSMAASRGGHDRYWGVNLAMACDQAQLDNVPDALGALDLVKDSHGLPQLPLLLDSPCFKRLAEEPRYKALIETFENRRRELRERLPRTLAEHGVADAAAGKTRVMSDREHLIRRLYAAALRRPIGERATFVAEQSGRDDDLRRRVEALLTGQQDTELPGQELAGGAMLAAGTLIGSYRIDGPLGAGGMGIVYRATDTKLDRPAAIKVLPENLADSEARRRFQREAKMVSSLNHPHIVTVYDAGEYQDRQYLITEYVDGGTLRQWAARARAWQQIVELLIGVADGIAIAHEAGILHRDIKPENILLAKNGYAKLADFGLAKLLEVDPLADDVLEAIKPSDNSTLIGTAAYMSPEQARGHALDGRSDVYSFGLVLYELLSGARPPARQDREQALPPLGEAVPAPLRAIVAKALEPEPDDRYQTMRDLVVDLRRLVRRTGLEDVRPSGPLDPLAAHTRPTAARARPVWARPAVYAAAIAAVAAVVLVAYYRADLRGAAQGKAVAVLPFTNETGNADDVPISEGLGDTLRERLMGLQGISVQARASSASFRGQNADPRTIARTLGVGVLISGTVRKHGDNIEVLVEVLDDKGFAIRQPLTFERAEQDLQALQQQIASEVGAVLVPAARASLATPAPVATSQSERANMLVLFGNHYDHEVRDDLTVDEKKLDKAIDYYRSATMADPKSIAAQTRLASALLYKGDFEAAREPLSVALDLAEATKSSLAAAELSDVYHTSAEYLQRTAAPAHEVEDAFKRALALNPSNADALGAYALWLVPRPGWPQNADPLFREAKRLDRQTILRYSDYAEYLGTADDIGKLHELAAEIVERFPNPRGYRALARLYELSGEIDVGVAWGIKALQAEPEDQETRWQVGELFSRIGDFVGAAKYDPKPAMNQLWLQRRYKKLVDLGQDYVIDHPDEIKAKYLLAFGYNAIEDFTSAKYLLEKMGLPPAPGTDPVREGNTDTQYPQFLASYVDALQSLGGNDALATDLARYHVALLYYPEGAVYAKGWWAGVNAACAKTQLGQYADALDLLERVVAAHGLVWSPLLQDSPCFKRLAAEPRYKAVVDRVEERKRQLRERLPATLREHGISDVTPNPAA